MIHRTRWIAKLLFLTLFFLSVESAAYPQGIFDPAMPVTRKYTVINNGGILTVTPTLSTLLPIPPGGLVNVNSGDVIFISTSALYNKGLTAGESSLSIEMNSGTATISTSPFHAISFDQANGTNRWLHVSGIFIVNAAGTIDFKITGSSAGSDSIIGVNNGFAMMIVFSQV